jgi:hypothetical protein
MERFLTWPNQYHFDDSVDVPDARNSPASEKPALET